MKIYCLLSEGCGRYIGKTSGTLKNRLREHLEEARSNKKNHRLSWLRSLKESPTIRLIAEVAGDGCAEEKYEIALARAYGCRLVNGTAGGEGMFNPSEEVREKMSVSNRGQRRSLETRENISKALTGKKRSPEVCLKMSLQRRGKKRGPQARANIAAGLRGHPVSDETRAKISTANKGRKHTPETRANMSKAHTGKRGAKRTPEQRKNISEGCKLRWKRKREREGL